MQKSEASGQSRGDNVEDYAAQQTVGLMTLEQLESCEERSVRGGGFVSVDAAVYHESRTVFRIARGEVRERQKLDGSFFTRRTDRADAAVVGIRFSQRLGEHVDLSVGVEVIVLDRWLHSTPRKTDHGTHPSSVAVLLRRVDGIHGRKTRTNHEPPQ